MRIASIGIPMIVGSLLLAAFLWWWSRSIPLTALLVLLAAFCAYFFRDPERSGPVGPDVALPPRTER